MKTLYLECNMGAAGDMLTAVLLELIDRPDDFIDKMNALGLSGVRVERKTSLKCGIKGTRVEVSVHGFHEESADAHENGHSHCHNHDHEHSHEHSHEHERGHHSHAGFSDISGVIESLPVSRRVKDDATAVYKLIAEAEAHAHGQRINDVHFHEVGTLDAVADIVGTCMLIEELSPKKIIASPVALGSGFVRCAHGVLPVPAPATAYILRGVPCYAGTVRGELCTPTGAALLKYFAGAFEPLPQMTIQKTGYGMGKKDFEAANCVRAFLGETSPQTGAANDEIAELCCNLDDMTGEEIGFATQALLDSGALDVFTAAIQMKKGRPATLVTCLCKPGDADYFAGLMLKYTTTFGVRKSIHPRYALARETKKLDAPFGTVRVKTGKGYGVKKSKTEYEDLAELAKREGISLSDAKTLITESAAKQ